MTDKTEDWMVELTSCILKTISFYYVVSPDDHENLYRKIIKLLRQHSPINDLDKLATSIAMKIIDKPEFEKLFKRAAQTEQTEAKLALAGAALEEIAYQADLIKISKIVRQTLEKIGNK